MKIFTKRNAVVGFVATKAAKRALARRRKKRSGLRIAGFVALGLVSVGILAGVAAVVLKKQRDDHEATETGEAAATDDEDEIVGEHVTTPEPIPAT